MDNYMTVAILIVAVLLLGWYMMQNKKSEGFLKCGAPVGERTLLAMNLGAEGAPAC